MNLGEKIYKYRVSKHLSQGELAEMLEVSRQSVSKWENNVAMPDLDKIVRLSEIFGITIDEMVKGESVINASDSDAKQILQKEQISRNNYSHERKIAGTILLCMAFLILLLMSIKGSISGGVVPAIPFLVCGLICFGIKQNTGLWCGWSIYLICDIYMRNITGASRKLIFNAYYYAVGATNVMTRALLFSWIQNLTLFLLAIITVLRFKNKPFEWNCKKILCLAAGTVILLITNIFQKFLPTTDFYREIYVRNHVHIHFIIDTVIEWVRILIGLPLIVNLVRYLFNREKIKNNTREKKA